MFKKAISIFMSAAMVVTGISLAPSSTKVDAAVNSSSGTSGWTLVWSDEFDGTSLNTNNWSYEIGNGSSGWGNNEIEYYTDRTDNARVSDGSLHIIAKRENYAGYQFTSARLKTQNKQYFRYGRIESKIKFTNSMQNGLWPAFWMLGNNISQVGWPKCGELDIMEHANSNTNVGGTFHWNVGNGTSHRYAGGSGGSYNDNQWHTFAVEWYQDCIKWYMDNNNYYTLSTTDSEMDEAHIQQFILLNFAIGGPNTGYTGQKTVPASFTQAEMEVDYVRVYQGADSAFLYNDKAGQGGSGAAIPSQDGWTNNGAWSGFSGQSTGWTGDATISGGTELGSFDMKINNSGSSSGNMWAVQAKAPSVSVVPNVTNTMSFTVTSDKPKTIWVQAENDDQTKPLEPTAINLTAGTNTYSFDFVPTADKTNIFFAMGYNEGDVAAAGSSANISVSNFKVGVGIQDTWTSNGAWSYYYGSWGPSYGTMDGGNTFNSFSINVGNSGSNGKYSVQTASQSVDVKANQNNTVSCNINSSIAKTVYLTVQDSTDKYIVSAKKYNLTAGSNTIACDFVPTTDTVKVFFALGHEDEDEDVAPANSSFKADFTNIAINGKGEEETTTEDTKTEPVVPFGVDCSSNSVGTFDIVMGNPGNGQTYNLYIDGKFIKNLTLGAHTIENITPGTHVIKLTGVLGNIESEGTEVSITVLGGATEEPTTVNSDVKADINGYQISTTAEGFRTIYTIDDAKDKVEKVGMVYGINNVSADDLVVGSSNSAVYNFDATENGKLAFTLGDSQTSHSYAMTMKFINSADFFNAKIYVRAYAKLKDGTYVYSDVSTVVVYNLASKLYENQLMKNYASHNYLYDKILTVVNPQYKEVTYNSGNIIVSPDEI